MPDEQTARLRRLVDWLSAGWADAATLADEMFALPPAGWDDWLAKHPDARSVHFFETLLDAADRKGVALTTFVLRHLQSLEVPPEAKMALVFLRGRAWTVHARLLRSARDVAGALEAYEAAAEVWR